MWHRLNSYKTTLQCHNESHSNSSSSHVQLELYHAPGKLHEKSSFLSSRLKAGRVVDEIRSTGRVFQTRAAMTRKAQSPTVDSRDVGMAKVSKVLLVQITGCLHISLSLLCNRLLCCFSTVLMLLKMIVEYCQLASDIPSAAPEILNRLIELLKV